VKKKDPTANKCGPSF